MFLSFTDTPLNMPEATGGGEVGEDVSLSHICKSLDCAPSPQKSKNKHSTNLLSSKSIVSSIYFEYLDDQMQLDM